MRKYIIDNYKLNGSLTTFGSTGICNRFFSKEMIVNKCDGSATSALSNVEKT